jgi:type II secretory pathway component PulF
MAKRSTWKASIAIGLGCGLLHGLLLLAELGVLLTVVPRFTAMFADLGASLPTPTMLAIGLSDTVRGFWFLWLPLGLMVTLANSALLTLLARWRGWLWGLLLGLLQALPLLLLPPLTVAAMYLPIFAMAEAVR